MAGANLSSRTKSYSKGYRAGVIGPLFLTYFESESLAESALRKACREEKSFVRGTNCRGPEVSRGGFEAAAAIRQAEKKSGQHLTIIAMTAHATVGDKERCLDAGMDDYISKPIHPAEISELLRKYSSAPLNEKAL